MIHEKAISAIRFYGFLAQVLVIWMRLDAGLTSAKVRGSNPRGDVVALRPNSRRAPGPSWGKLRLGHTTLLTRFRR